MNKRNQTNNDCLKIGIPKKGRLRMPVIKMLKQANYVFNAAENILHSQCLNEKIDFIFLRTNDIPTLIQQKKIDLGITGSDIVKEKTSDLIELLSLKTGNCSLVLAGPNNYQYRNLTQLKGKKIATSFPNLTKKFFKKKKISIDCINLSGSIEVMLRLNVCDAIVDLVETGTTLKENQIDQWEVLGNYHLGVFSLKETTKSPIITSFLKRLTGIVIASHYSILEYNIKKPLLSQAEKITPGLDAPTISHLDNPQMVAVKVMIKKDLVVPAMDELEKIGASGIFEIKITNCRL